MQKLKLTIFISCLSFFALTSSCSEDSEEEMKPDIEQETLTYTNDIKTIIDAKCNACHGNGQSPSLTTFAEVSAKVSRIKARAIDAKNMPPVNSSFSLEESEITKLSTWISQGAKE